MALKRASVARQARKGLCLNLSFCKMATGEFAQDLYETEVHEATLNF
jgi:hypothetical protein